MATVLVVDDSAVDRKLAGGCLRACGFDVEYAENGAEALELIEQHLPDIVLTDLVMPEVDGLELVSQIKKSYRSLPVILMTAHGNEEIAVTALKTGAANYVPKKNLSRDLEETVLNVLSVAQMEQAEQLVFDSLSRVELTFELGNDLAALRPLIAYMQSQMRQLHLCEESDVIRISSALQEALVNAIEHGNLELDSALRELKDNTYSRLGTERRGLDPYKDRKVHVAAVFDRDQATWTIRDEGGGFDPQTLPDPTDPANLQRVSGRGLLLIRTFMDEVSFGGHANEIRMTKRRIRNGEPVS